MIMREVLPCSSVRAVILPDGSPGTFAEIGSPSLPMFGTRRGFGEAKFFLRHESVISPVTPWKSVKAQIVYLSRANRVQTRVCIFKLCSKRLIPFAGH